jgi:hypothetical protein
MLGRVARLQAERKWKSPSRATEGRVPRNEVDVDDAEVLVDGVSKARLPLKEELFLEPGEHAFESRLRGYAPARASISAPAGTQHVVALKLAPIDRPSAPAGNGGSEPTPTETHQPASQPHPHTALLLAGGTLAVAGLAVGVGSTVAANNKADERDARVRTLSGQSPCGAGSNLETECSAIRDLDDSHDRLRTLGWIGFGVAGAAAGATVAYWVWPRRPAQTASTRFKGLLRRSGCWLAREVGS